ncbi:MAG TPA: protoglobin domain-containing protein [Calditrichia bacterium]|nr:hypothetical protein [Calditrichota bacterium]HQV33347.1 protoglobin domain-containing protein [Calditrichia bacterium]
MQHILKNLVTLTGASQQDFRLLKDAAPYLFDWTPVIAKQYYDILFSNLPKDAAPSAEERRKLERELDGWMKKIITNNMDNEFWREQWKRGLVHIKAKTSIHMVLGMISRIQLLFLYICVNEFELKQARKVYGAFKRVTDLVAGIFAESYFENYLGAVGTATGVSKKLLEREIFVEVDKMIGQVRGELEKES